MNITIRTAKISDLDQYADLLQATYQYAYTNERIGLTADCFSKEIFASGSTRDYLKSHLIDNDTQKTWLAFDDNILVGSITCILKNDKEADLTGYYVHPDYQGRAIGKQLYKLATDFAGQRDLLLDIYTHNTRAIKMYRKWGWEVNTSKGENGYFYRHWPEWPENVQAKCMYMILRGKHE